MPATSKHHLAPLGMVVRLGNLSSVTVTQYEGDELVTIRLADTNASIDIVGPLVGPERGRMGIYSLIIEIERQLSRLVHPPV